MSTKKLGVTALVAVLVIGVLVIGVLVIVAPQDDMPAEQAAPEAEVEEVTPAIVTPQDDPPAEEAPPAPITTPDEIVPPAGFTSILTMDVQGATVTQYIGSGTAEDALDAFKTSVTDAGWTPIFEGEVPAVFIPEAGIAAGTTGVGFERGDEFLGIWVMQAEDQTGVTVAIVPKEVLAALQNGVIPAEVIIPPEEAPPEAVTVLPIPFSELIEFLPDAPSGWVAEEPYGIMMTFEEWSWSMADRYYAKSGTDTHAAITIVDGAYHAVGPWMMWGAFFEYEHADGYLKSTTFDGFPAWEEHYKTLRYTPAKGDHTIDNYTLRVGINGRFMVLISVYDSDRDTLYAFADKIDFRGIAGLK